MVDRIRWDPIYHFIMSFFEIDFQFLLLTIFNLQANILTTKDILSNLVTWQLLAQQCPKDLLARRYSCERMDGGNLDRHPKDISVVKDSSV